MSHCCEFPGAKTIAVGVGAGDVRVPGIVELYSVQGASGIERIVDVIVIEAAPGFGLGTESVKPGSGPVNAVRMRKWNFGG